MSNRQRQVEWVPRYYRLRQLAWVPRYNRVDDHYDNSIDNFAESPAGEAINTSVPDDTEDCINIKLTRSAAPISISLSDGGGSSEVIESEKAFSDNVLTEAVAPAASHCCTVRRLNAATTQTLGVDEVDLLKKILNDCVIQDNETSQYIFKIIESASNNQKYELLPILRDFTKYLQSEKAKDTARKNTVNRNNDTKYKSKLMKLLTPRSQNESKLSENIFDREICYMVDVMNNVRCIQWKKFENKTFKILAEVFCESVKEKCKNPKRIDFVFDIYHTFSPKSAERVKRYGDIKPIEFSVGADESLPIGRERQFWACEKNKVEVQEYIRQFIVENYARYWESAVVVLSDTNKATCKVCPSQSSDSPPENIDCQSLRRNDIDEADDRVMLHINDAIRCGYDKICVLSQDTDIFVGAMYFYWKAFKNIGLKELWMAIPGGQEKFRPIHEFAEAQGPELCEVLPAMHNLTGADCTKKVGTKNQGLVALPVKFLANFARGTSREEVSTSVNLAEEYLIQVVRNGNGSKTFDELSNSPMTSASVRQHILRAFYVTHKNINILDANYIPLDPRSYGYQEINGLLMPIEPEYDEENVAAQV